MKTLDIQTWINEFNPEEINLDKIQDYLEVIQNATKEYDETRYSEKHHILPRCLDKDHTYINEWVKINGREHYLAHRELINCFNGDKKRRVCFALTKMLGHCEKFITPEEYEEIRKLNSEALKGNQYAKGLIHTEESRKKMSERHRKTDSEETRKKRSQSLMGHTVSKETREKISKSLTGKPGPGNGNYWLGKHHKEESKEKISSSLYKYYQNITEDERKCLSERVKGKKNPMYGKHHTEEACKKMSESRKGNQNAKGNIWITNGIENKIIRDIKDLPIGWQRGMTRSKCNKGDKKNG